MGLPQSKARAPSCLKHEGKYDGILFLFKVDGKYNLGFRCFPRTMIKSGDCCISNRDKTTKIRLA